MKKKKKKKKVEESGGRVWARRSPRGYVSRFGVEGSGLHMVGSYVRLIDFCITRL